MSEIDSQADGVAEFPPGRDPAAGDRAEAELTVQSEERTEGASQSYLAGLGVVLLLIVAAWASSLEISRPEAPKERDAITANERRFEELKKSLPPHGVVGYLSDLDPSTAYGIQQLYLTEYSLAPLQVASSSDQAIVVGNFSDVSVAPAMAARNGLRIARDFGNGAMLLVRGGE